MPISSTSFLRGFAFPYKKTWASHCIAAHTLSPADTRLSPQHWLGAAGCDSRAGLVRFPLAQADDELWHGEATRGCAWRFEPLTSILSVSHAPQTHHSHESSISHLADYEFAYARSAPRLRSTGAIFACVILVRSFFLRTNPCAQLCTCSVPSCCRVVPCGYCGMRHVSWSSCVMNWA